MVVMSLSLFCRTVSFPPSGPNVNATTAPGSSPDQVPAGRQLPAGAAATTSTTFGQQVVTVGSTGRTTGAGTGTHVCGPAPEDPVDRTGGAAGTGRHSVSP